jgi:hypothetical protein
VTGRCPRRPSVAGSREAPLPGRRSTRTSRHAARGRRTVHRDQARSSLVGEMGPSGRAVR